MPHIAILGSGFAALTALRELRRRRVDADITVISPRDDLHYLPSSIWIPGGQASRAALQVPLAPVFKRLNACHISARVTGLSGAEGRIDTDAGPIMADQIIVATGGRFLRGLKGIEHAIIPCEGLASGEAIAARMAAMTGGTIAIGFSTNPAEQGAVRGGPVFEYLFNIDQLLRDQGRRDQFRLIFFSPSSRPGVRLGEKAVDSLLAEMARRGIETHLGSKLLRLEADAVVTEAARLPADLILFQPGMIGPDWLADSDLLPSPGGMIKADARTLAEGQTRVWVAGDAGSYPGPDWLPKQAHQADLQAKASAANIASVLAGRSPVTAFKSELICILDARNSGMLVYRSLRFNLMLPRLRVLHWAKRLFEGLYLRPYR